VIVDLVYSTKIYTYQRLATSSITEISASQVSINALIAEDYKVGSLHSVDGS
jgi:hypothetical protein